MFGELLAAALCDRSSRNYRFHYGKLTDKENIIYFGNLQYLSGSIVHTGDNLTGAGDGDDEVIIIDLPRIPADIAKLVFVINIYDCIARKQDFTQVDNAFVRFVNAAKERKFNNLQF
ncbi:TerD family protein [Aphanizomenon sp. UHCC 0183]|uniref:TerD family protein n=1 Tax=Aphanizomenon sp. UHCC 0183 TaxID=2590028 RepID=UPI0020C52439|nr:TerD family protein [Aphanizomenon sp. UHCC 0183]